MSNLDKIRYANGGTPTADLRMNMQKVIEGRFFSSKFPNTEKPTRARGRRPSDYIVPFGNL